MNPGPDPTAWTEPLLTTVQGADAPILVVHGGPGMDSSYLRPLDGLLRGSAELVYYDQLPLPEEVGSHSVTADDQVDELGRVILQVSARSGGPIRLIAHSWGTYLVLNALATEKIRAKTSAVALLNPLPLTWDRLGEAGNRLMARVRPEDIDEVTRLEELGTEDSGRDLMALVGYAYLAPANTRAVRIAFDRYSPVVNAEVLTSVGGYDQRGCAAVVAHLPVLAVYGDSDHFEPKDTEELALGGAEVRILANCGHFPCHEASEALGAALREFFGRSGQR